MAGRDSNPVERPFGTARVRSSWFDETGGEKDNVNTLLILALIVLPLLIILIAFREQVVDYFQESAAETFESGQASP